MTNATAAGEISGRIRLSRSVVGGEELAGVAEVIRRGYLGMGPEVEAFESELRAHLESDRDVTCVSSGTAALHLAIQACGLGRGDEILVPSLTYVATYQAIAATGAVPVSCEIRPEDCTLDVDDARRRITPRTRAVLPVHYASELGDIDGVYALASEHGLRVVEDAAHAFGCERQGRKVGSFGDVVCFSFDGIKNITSGEGGAVVTDDAEVTSRIRDARLLGVHKDSERRYAGERSWEFDVVAPGFRYHMSDLMAAIGRAQLRRFEEEFRPKRVSLALRYRAELADVSGVTLLRGAPGATVPHIFPIRVTGGRRDGVRTALLEVGAEAGIHYKPNHLLSFFPGAPGDLPVTEQLYEEILSLPLHPCLTIGEQDRVVEVIRRTLDG